MTWPILARLTLALLWSSIIIRAQEPGASTQAPPANAPAPSPPPPAPAPKHLLFGGTVTQLDSKHITVSRTLPGKSPEHRIFLIDARTKMSRAIKLRALVTVRYRRLPEGDVALEIQLRPLRTPRAS